MGTVSKIIISVICSLIILLCGISIGIAIGNAERKEYLNDWADETLTACEEDGLSNCHIEQIYHGLVFVDFEINGEENNK